MAPLNPEDRQTGTSHHITQSLADPPPSARPPRWLCSSPFPLGQHGQHGAAPAAGLFSNANPRQGIYSALIPAEPILGRCSGTRAAQVILTQRWVIYRAALLCTCSEMDSNYQALFGVGETGERGEEGPCKGVSEI